MSKGKPQNDIVPERMLTDDGKYPLTYQQWLERTEVLRTQVDRQRDALGTLISHHFHKHNKCRGADLTEHGVPEIVTLCGSMRRAGTRIMEVAAEQTLKGRVVLAPFATKPQGQTETEELLDDLNDLHRWKMAVASRVIFVTVGKYMGVSTSSELEWCIQHSKPHVVRDFPVADRCPWGHDGWEVTSEGVVLCAEMVCPNYVNKHMR